MELLAGCWRRLQDISFWWNESFAFVLLRGNTLSMGVTKCINHGKDDWPEIGLSFISFARSFEASCHSLVIVRGVEAIRRRNWSRDLQNRAKRRTVSMDRIEHDSANANQPNSRQEYFQVVSRLTSRRTRPMRPKSHVISCRKKGAKKCVNTTFTTRPQYWRNESDNIPTRKGTQKVTYLPSFRQGTVPSSLSLATPPTVRAQWVFPGYSFSPIELLYYREEQAPYGLRSVRPRSRTMQQRSDELGWPLPLSGIFVEQ